MLTRRTLLGGAGGFVRDPGNCRRTRAGDNVACRSGEPPSGPAALRPCHGVGPGHRQVVLPRLRRQDPVYRGSPTSVMTPLPSTGIRLGAAGTARSIPSRAMDSGRTYFSVGQALKFFSTPAAASSCRP